MRIGRGALFAGALALCAYPIAAASLAVGIADGALDTAAPWLLLLAAVFCNAAGTALALASLLWRGGGLRAWALLAMNVVPLAGVLTCGLILIVLSTA